MVSRRGFIRRLVFVLAVAAAVLSYLFLTKQPPFQRHEKKDGVSSASGIIKIASWNIRTLSKKKADEDLRIIADIMTGFDLIAVQEPKDTEVLDRVLRFLPGWKYLSAEPVGRGTSTERYAFFWKTQAVSLVGTPSIVKDPRDRFIREPFTATFRAGEFDFTLCTIHVLFGNSKDERRRELRLLDELLASIQRANGSEDDVILLGDFNAPPDDAGWQMGSWKALVQPPAKTTVGEVSLYDNIWFDPDLTREYAGSFGVKAFDTEAFPGGVRDARRRVSDHRPVWAAFSTAGPDDDANEYGNLSDAEIAVAPPPPHDWRLGAPGSGFRLYQKIRTPPALVDGWSQNRWWAILDLNQ